MTMMARALHIKSIAIVAVLGLCAVISGKSAAQVEKPSSLSAFAAVLSQKYNSTVVIDPALKLVGDPIHVDARHGVERALAQLASRLANAKVRRILLSHPLPMPDQSVELAEFARMADSIPLKSVLLEDVHKRSSVLLERYIPPANAPQRDEHVSPRLVYLVYCTLPRTAEYGSMEARFASNHRELAALLEAAPEIRAKATESSMLWWKDMEPATLKPLIEKIGSAANQEWEGAEPASRNGLIAEFLDTAKRAMSALNAPDGDAGRAGSNPANYRDQLVEFARSLGGRHRTRIEVDPSVYLTVRPQSPPRTIELIPAVSTMMTPLTGTRWRQVLHNVTAGPTPYDVRSMSRFARWCDSSDLMDFTMVDPANGEATMVRRVTSGLDPLKAKFAVCDYLLYAASAPDNGPPVPPFGRLAGLLRAQQQLMIGMDVGQFGRLMHQEVQGWNTLDSSSREAAMSQPMLAGMMAVWMPRQAKERKEP